MKQNSLLHTPQNLEKVAEVFRAIGHPFRLTIIELIRKNGPLTVGVLTQTLNSEQSLVSHHLTLMKNAGILRASRNGKFISYSDVSDELFSLVDRVNDNFVK